MKKNKLSVCLIVGNEEQHIERFIKSFAWAADEFCITFANGSAEFDATSERARELCEKFGVPWIIDEYENKPECADWPHCDDFAAARQVSFDRATGDWLMWADADDVFEETPQNKFFIDGLKDGKLDDHPVYRCNWNIKNAGQVAVRERFVRRDLGAAWRCPVHEYLTYSDAVTPVFVSGVEVVHDPLTVSDERTREHNDRNIRIAKHHYETTGDNEMLYLLHRDSVCNRDFAAAKEYGEKLLPDKNKLKPEALYEVLLNLGVIEVQQGNPALARARLLTAVGTEPYRAEAYFGLASVELRTNHPRQALGYTTAGVGQQLPHEALRPWNLDASLYGWRGLHQHATALRANGRAREASNVENTAFGIVRQDAPRFVICAKDADVRAPNFQNLHEHMELGWEVAVTHVRAKTMLHEGTLTDGDIIVTLPGREFFYTRHFKNVITWRQFCAFKNLNPAYGHPNVWAADTIDLQEQAERNGMLYHERYFADNGKFAADGELLGVVQNFDVADSIKQELNSILKGEIKTSALAVPSLFVALRVRKHQSERNTDEGFSLELLGRLRMETELPIYLVGLDLPDFGVKNVFHVSLQEWLARVRLSDCRGILAPLTGTAVAAWQFTTEPTKFVLFPRAYCASIGHPNIVTGMGEPLNFANNTKVYCPVGCDAATVVDTAKKEGCL